MQTGTVKFFIPDRGYGFLVPDDGSRDVFFDYQAVLDAGLKTPAKGDRVSFVADRDDRGRTFARLGPAP